MNASVVKSILDGVTLLFFLLLLVLPFLFAVKLKTKNYFKLLVFSLFLSFLFLLLSTYWSEEMSTQIIYQMYGFDPSGFNEGEKWLKTPTPEDQIIIEAIFARSGGVGWPVKFMLACVFYALPYSLIVSGVVAWLKRKK